MSFPNSFQTTGGCTIFLLQPQYIYCLLYIVYNRIYELNILYRLKTPSQGHNILKTNNETNNETNLISFQKPPKKDNIPIEIVQDKISIFNEIDTLVHK